MRETFYMVDHTPVYALTKILFATRMLTRDLLAVTVTVTDCFLAQQWQYI